MDILLDLRHVDFIFRVSIHPERIMRLFGWILLCLTIQGSVQDEDDCLNFTRLTFEKPGNMTITGRFITQLSLPAHISRVNKFSVCLGIFDRNSGENCSSSVDFGVEEMAAALWTVTALERYNYLPGIKIGKFR